MELYSDELNALIHLKENQPRPVAKSTLKKYIQVYLYLTESLNKSGDWVSQSSTENLVKIINNLDMKPTGKLTNLAIFIMIRSDTLDIQTLIDLRNKLYKKREIQIKELIQHKKETLPDYKTVSKYIDELYKDKKYTDYLVNNNPSLSLFAESNTRRERTTIFLTP